MDERFFECSICGNVAIMAVFSGVAPHCCGEEMALLYPNTTDGSHDKHVPIVEMINDHRMKVKVGSIPHPMTEEHHIKFICLETEDGYQLRYLEPGGEPEAYFNFCGTPQTVYAYCNLHGLWKTNL